MKIFKYEEIAASNGLVKSYELNQNELGDICPAEFYLYIDSDITVDVVGYINNERQLATPKVINVGTFEKKDTIATAGLYLIMSSGYSKIELTFNGNANAIAKIII